MFGYIYKTTNLVNNKIYIGQKKSTTFKENYLGSGVNIRKAIKKYSKNNFSVELIECCDSQQQLDERERYYIDEFNSQNVEIGYNITNGGQSRFFTGQHHSEESKQKMSEKAKKREHMPTTRGRKTYTDGKQNKMILPEEVEYYESIGWWHGKTTNQVPWNKGLKKETDERVAKYTEKRNQHFKNGESIGCFGVKGNTYGFTKGQTPWNKGLKGYNNGHPNYYHGKNKDKIK